MLGALYALFSAATFGFNTASARRGMVSATVFQGLAVTVPIGVPLFAVFALATGEITAVTRFPAPAYLYLGLAGIVHFVWGRYCAYRAVKAMGGNLAAPVQNANLLVALGLAIIVLGERLTPLKIIGIVLIVIGPVIAVPTRRDTAARRPTAGEVPFRPKLLEGYTWAVMSATGYGLSPVLIRLGLSGMHGASFAGGLISYSAATVFFSLFLIPRGRLAHVLSMERRALPWFVNSGFFVFLAQMFRYLALSIAPVTVVSPVQRLSGIFRIIFTTLLNRDYEVINSRLVIGTVVSILGAITLTMSVDVVAAHIALPRTFLEWSWP